MAQQIENREANRIRTFGFPAHLIRGDSTSKLVIRLGDGSVAGVGIVDTDEIGEEDTDRGLVSRWDME